MTFPLLPWLNDQKFIALVEGVLKSGFEATTKADKKLGRNVIDPFLMLFEMGSFNLNIENWITNEKMRQAQKSLTNKIGLFHQDVLGSLDDWENLGTQEVIDVVNHEKCIIAEIKNKHNTIKKSDQIGLYDTLEKLVMPKTQKYHDYTAYYVEIIPKSAVRYNEPFIPSNRETGKRAAANNLIRKIDGASFYALASGHDHALAQLYDALPKTIEIILQKMEKDIPKLDTAMLRTYFVKAYGENE